MRVTIGARPRLSMEESDKVVGRDKRSSEPCLTVVLAWLPVVCNAPVAAIHLD